MNKTLVFLDDINILEESSKDDTAVPKIKDATNVASKVMHKVLTKLNNNESNNYLNVLEEKNKKGSNGMEPNKLSTDLINYNEWKYLNVSVDSDNDRAEMAEWSTQSAVNRCPSGCVGSIPTLGAAENCAEINNQGKIKEVISILIKLIKDKLK